MFRWSSLTVLGLCCVAAACNERLAAASAANARSDAPHVAAGVVDSSLPMPALLERFRRGVPRVEALRGSVTTRDELVRRVVAAIAQRDTATITAATVDLAEYAWLYFPTTRVAQPPYEVPPALAWFQVQEKNRRGALRAMRELGGHRVVLRGYHCDEMPTIEAENRVWTGCAVTISRDGETRAELELFGAILERGGRFEVLSYQNDF